MPQILLTGMSGTGKSSALTLLHDHGFDTVDTDTDEWSRWDTLPDGSADWIWDEGAMTSLLTTPRAAPLFVAGCKTNQGAFYPLFDHIVLLSAPVEVILRRVAERSNNPYGHTTQERAEIVKYVEEVEPLLRKSATLVIDASVPLRDVVVQLTRLAVP